MQALLIACHIIEHVVVILHMKRRYLSEGAGRNCVQQSSCERAADVSISLMAAGLDVLLRRLKS